MREMNSEHNGKSAGGITLPLLVHAVLFMLGLWGCLAIYNATVYSNAPFYLAGRQFIWLIAGLFAMHYASKVEFSLYRKYAPFLAVLIYIPLLLVLVFGIKINGMKGWFAFGSVFIQPSELAKPFFILALCWVCDRYSSASKKFLILFIVTALWILPVSFQPDFGTVLVYVFGMAAVYLIAGGSYMFMLVSVFAVIPAGLLIVIEKPYVLARITGFLNPLADPTGAGWHILQFQYTLARGGLFGASWGNCLWANSYLPLSYSDSAFAALTEAIGFIGVLPVIFGFTIFAYVGYRMASRTEENMRRIFICSMTSMVTFQAFVHISVNVGLMPPTGITLPMFSYGGSSLLSTMIGAGIILSAARVGKTETAGMPATGEGIISHNIADKPGAR
jgi:cell division protein FtsW